MRTIEAAKGRWREILTQVGGVDARVLDGKHHPCPVTGEGTDRFRFADRDGGGSFFCACSQGGDGMELLKCCTGKGFSEVAAEVDRLVGRTHERGETKPMSYAQRLRGIAVTSKRSLYLESRGLEVAPGLLFAKAVDYFDGEKVIGRFAAMLAPITTSRGEFRTFHVTYLCRGKKADVTPPRKVLPGGGINGCGVALYPAAEVMGVAEGIETAIAAKILHGMPVHSAISAQGVAKWEPPAVAREVHIFGDNDANYAGHAGAYQLAHRLALKGVRTLLRFPSDVGDWNDVLLNQRSAP